MNSDPYADMPHPADRDDSPGTAVATLPANLPATAVASAQTVETARVQAEIEARVLVARKWPRDLKLVETGVRQSVSRIRTPFYTVPRGNKSIQGLTVEVMREVLRCFGNAQSGSQEVARGDGYSEMLAWAWDLESNTYQQMVFVVSHVRDRAAGKGGPQALTTNQDLYELLAGNAGRREREMIKRILPKWLEQLAEEVARSGLIGKPEEFSDRLAKAVQLFARWKVTEPMLEARLGVPRAAWGQPDLVQLQQFALAIQHGEQRPADEFPELASGDGGGRQVGSAEDALKAAQQEAAAKLDGKATPATVTRADMLTAIGGMFTNAGLGDKTPKVRAQRLAVVALLAREHDDDQPVQVGNPDALNDGQVQRVYDRLAAVIREATTAKQDIKAALEAIAADCARLLPPVKGDKP